MNNTRYLELDFYRTGYRAVKAHQYDKNTRFIEITCVNDASPFPLDPVRMTCDLKLKTPDGRHMFKTEVIQPDGKVLVALEDSMLLASGICKAELNIYELGSRKLLSTMPFDLIVVGSVYDNTVIENSNEFSVLSDMIFYNKELGDSLEQLETDVTAAEAGRNTAESERVGSEEARVRKEKARVAAENVRAETENTRITAENNRNTAEAERKVNESSRIAKEANRQYAEAERAAEEQKRTENENTRTANEAKRKTAEDARAAAEIKRAEADNTRTSNEDTRTRNEMNRQKAEQQRSAGFDALQAAMNTELGKLENINVEALSEKNSYKIKISDQSGNSTVSPNLLNTLEIGTVETGDAEENPTASITGNFGSQKLNLRLPSGKPFKIGKTYTSIDAMNADVNNIDLYEFIMINTGSVEDEDTGKLYMKDTMGMTFITDLSGVQGIQGVKGEIGITPQLTIGTVTTGEPDTEVNVAITGTAEKPVVNFVIPRGKDGTSIRVKGNAESEYREGDVNITPENIGLGKVGNYKAVSTESSQGLSAAEKANARANIGAGTSSFSGNYNDLSNRPAIPGVQNNLTSSSTTDSLSANQGKLLASGSARDNTKLPLTGGTLSGGDLNINGNDVGTRGLRIRRNGSDHESAFFRVNDGGLVVDSKQDEDSASITLNLIYTDTEKNGGANAGQKKARFYASNAAGAVLEIDRVNIQAIGGSGVKFDNPIKSVGVQLGWSEIPYIYGENDDIWMRYKDDEGVTSYTSAKTIMRLIGEINNALKITANIPKTPITWTTSGVNLTPGSETFSFYMVKNGWCFFQVTCTLDEINKYYNLNFYLPKPMFGNYAYFRARDGEVRINASGQIRVWASSGSYNDGIVQICGSYPIL